ncbi:high affinity cationic amino acid transporter 1-like [Zophobas morio]|uniref:high affinity cationic amino acid transporter 1-like n=1 Tax=Zophobas morio TaxID=2755281 RepID=UPI00308353A7
MGTVWKVLTRKKVLDPVSAEQSELGRILNTLDLTALGVGSTLGVGVYVLAGHVAKDTAGPAVVLSFLIATIASVFAGLCYAEFGARTPRAGSAYIYSYVCVGEFIAFVIGWNLVLEYVIGSASVARGLSLYLDTLINDTLKDCFIDIAPLGNVSFMSAYFDFFAFGISLILAVALAFGLKESSWANNIFTLVNLAVVLFVVIAGATKASTENWNLVINATNSTDENKGTGGFFPFGVEGMIKGAATCFYGFVGFDCIATTGEEVKNPKKAIPFAIILSLFIIFLAYFGTSTVVTLMVPYYDQDPNAPLPHAFESVGLEWAKWVVAIGGIFGLCASLFGAMFPLPRIIYAMASDSIIFRFLGQVSSRFKTPVVGTLLAGLLTGLMAALFELKQLVNMMSIGTLLAYTIVAASVLLLRYEVDKGVVYEPLLKSFSDSEDYDTYTESRALDIGETSDEIELISDEFTSSNIFKQIFNCGRQQYPSEVSERIVKVEVCLYCILCVLIGLCAMYLNSQIRDGEIWAIVLTAVVVALAVLVVMSMTTQPKSRKELSFKVPLVPLVPALSILINIYLMLMLDNNTWIRFGVWMAVGLPIYYFSVKTHSDARNESICSHPSISAGEKINGYANHGYLEDEIISTKTKKGPAPPPPTLKNIEATIADLDEMLENEEANITTDRKYSADSMSLASNVLREENVQADVHCSDVPLTPAKDEPPLCQSSDVTCSDPVSHNSDVTNAHVADTTDSAVLESEDTVQNDDAEPAAVVVGIPLIPEEPEEPEEQGPVVKIALMPEDAHVEEEQEEPPTEEQSLIVNTNETISQESQPVPVENETTTEENEKIIEESEPKNPVIPPPPPLTEEMETFNDTPRPHFDKNVFSGVKLRSIHDRKPETPPIDYSRQNSTVGPADTNLKFGTQEYKEFIEQLDQKLQQGYIPAHVAVELKKKPVLKNTTSHIANEDVVNDSIDRDDAKKKLALFLERTNSLPAFTVRNGPNSDRKYIGKKINEVESDLSGYKEQHRQNMENIFRSVRLRKEDSFKNTSRSDDLTNASPGPHEKKAKENEDIDRSEHRKNMDGIFQSIRLMKVDSFKNDESH